MSTTKNQTLLEAECNHHVWTLQTSVDSIKESLTCKRPKNSRGMGWQPLGKDTFVGRFYAFPEVRANLYRLVMRGCTNDFEIIPDGSSYLLITATDDGYVDRLPKLAKHSQKSAYELAKQLSETQSTRDVGLN